MLEIEERTDLCLCLGTSLSGMNADRCATTPAKRMMKGTRLGTVLINLQQTKLDKKCAVRVWSLLDRAFEVLAEILGVEVTSTNVPLMPNSVTVPYNTEGKLDLHSRMRLDLSNNARICIPVEEAVNAHETGFVRARDHEGNIRVCVGGKNRVLGRWWMLHAVRGEVPALPLLNERPQVERTDVPYEVPEEWRRPA
eukprot:TRINITY_DN112_c0_g1_i10.p2 TRINITY_DN112_c0_g1~~TRINITY_DN112_c0_g1_i10.p2  ORF type:complete len:196 (-),score=59.63 TRINITY_DN112_c0_g1_i10:134-721(-)